MGWSSNRRGDSRCRLWGGLAIEPRVRDLEIFTQTVMLRGQVETWRRLTDFFNDAEQFVPIHDVRVLNYYGDDPVGLEPHDYGAVQRDSIILVSEINPGAADPEPPPTSPRTDLHIPKVPTRVLFYTDHLAINADVHLAPSVSIRALVAPRANEFIPITNVSVAPLLTEAIKPFRRD